MLGPSQMESWDRCRRQWQFLDKYKQVRVTPIGAVYQALRHVLVLAEQDYTGPHMAREMVMELASTRGVQTERPDPYDLMVHHSHLAECLARVLRQASAPLLELHPPIPLPQFQSDRPVNKGNLLAWQPESYLIAGGTRLMRFVLVDRWDDDRQLAEMHSWRTIGDVCMTNLPMTIRVLVIGASREGRRYGHWTRARQHPYDKSIRFKRKHGREDFGGEWRVVWREETSMTADKWIERMAADGVLRESAFEVKVRVPDDYQRGRVLDDIARIGLEMQWAKDMHTQFPMTRSACDSTLYGTCQFQSVCYAPMEISPEETGLFKRREGRDESNGKRKAN
jgi:hypothetical protein